MLITRCKYDTLDTCKTSIFDPESGLSFQDPRVKHDITKLIGLVCHNCPPEPLRKFPTQEALVNHYEKAHKLFFCSECLSHKPVLLFEQKLYHVGKVQQHLRTEHPVCEFCYNKPFYD